MSDLFSSFALDPGSDPCAPVMRTRTETLRPLVQVATVDRRMLDHPEVCDPARIWQRLRERLVQRCEETHRLIHGDIAISTHEDYRRDAVVFTARAMTRRSTEGQWWEIWEAIDEDGWWD